MRLRSYLRVQVLCEAGKESMTPLIVLLYLLAGFFAIDCSQA
jgi:hypothetical protein